MAPRPASEFVAYFEQSMPDDNQPDSKSSAGKSEAVLTIGVAVLVFGLAFMVFKTTRTEDPTEKILGAAPQSSGSYASESASTNKYKNGHYVERGFANHWNPANTATFWLTEVPDAIRDASPDTGTNSNIRLADYAGHESCLDCHEDNHVAWRNHPHSRMNAYATPENVIGDFSGTKEIRYLGGVARFHTKDGQYRMELTRESRRRVYAITRTIGSRFFQYYVGTLVEGDPRESPASRTLEHVLPFGYWIDEAEWVPSVHVFRATDHDDDRRDPFSDHDIAPYDGGCSTCHTTRPFGDWAVNPGGAKRLAGLAPRSIAFDVSGYVESERPQFALKKSPGEISDADVLQLQEQFNMLPFKGHGVSLGIACEACHNGCDDHVKRSTKTKSDYLPAFFPKSPHVFTPSNNPNQPADAEALKTIHARTKENSNFICARCHSGGRPRYANGVDTWNSTEFSDAVKGSCYKKSDPHSTRETLSCVHCHDPHQGIGKKWKPSRQEDNASCLSCHAEFKDAKRLTAHTHHAADSVGSDCMNCHMPKINEGMQDMVRTHCIFNPTDKEMIEANQPNACNLCHLEKTIDWTIDHLRDWFGREHRYSERALVRNYPTRGQAAGLGWLRSRHGPTRLAAAEAAAKAKAKWALPDLLRLLVEDEYIINRQFTQRRLEEWLGFKFKDKGYRYYMTEPERLEAITRIAGELQTGGSLRLQASNSK